MLNITNYWRNANQNHKEVLPHTSQNGQHKKDYKQQMLECAEKGNSMEIPQKTKNRPTI